MLSTYRYVVQPARGAQGCHLQKVRTHDILGALFGGNRPSVITRLEICLCSFKLIGVVKFTFFSREV